MKLVTFSGAMSPHVAGDTRLVPDDVAEALRKDGAVRAIEDWPAPVQGEIRQAAAPQGRQAKASERQPRSRDTRKAR